MSALKHFKIILLLICVSLSMIEPRKKYPRIRDVVSFLEDPHYIPRAVKKIKSGLDVARFRNNTALLRKLVRDNLDHQALSVKQPSRRIYTDLYGLKGSKPEAYNLQFRTKIIDCMLQLVYMARHYMKTFERQEYLDRTSLAYRIGYVCKKLRILFHKSKKILLILNKKQMNGEWGTVPLDVSTPLTLHHKVAKMNVDFEYFYVVLKRLHAQKVPLEPPRLHLKVYQLPTSMDQFKYDTG